MSEQYTPTTEEVLGMLGSYLYEYGAGCDMNLPGNSPDEIVDRWLAEVERASAEKAYKRGRLDERHDCNRFQEYCDGLLTEEQLKNSLRSRNPYRRKGAK